MRRQRGFVRAYKTWLSLEEGASLLEWRRAEMIQAIQLGIIPAFRLSDGRTVVSAESIAGFDRRVTEHD